MARAPSTPVFAVGVIAALVARAAILAAILGFTRRRFMSAVRFYLVALVPALLASCLDFSGRAILYAYLIWGGLLVLIATVLVLGAVPWMGAESLRAAFARARRERFRLGLLAVALVTVAIIGTMWRRPGAFSQVLVLPLSGALTAAIATRLSTPPRRWVSARGIALIATGIIAVLAVIAFVLPGTGGVSKVVSPPLRRGSLLLIAGVDTTTGHGALFRFNPRSVGFLCDQTYYYSYAGPGHGGPQGEARCPIRRGAPYRKSDTTRPLRQLTAALLTQLRGLPRPVVVVTHSQGAWIAWAELSTNPRAAVGSLVMLAPFDEGLAPYPPPGADGDGAAGGAAVRIVTDLGRAVGISQFDPDSPLARELQATPGAVRRLVARPLPRSIRAAAVLARGDLPLEPRPWPHGIPQACPGWLTHAALPTSSQVTSVVDAFLDRHVLPPCPEWVANAGHAADAFGAPPPGA